MNNPINDTVMNLAPSAQYNDGTKIEFIKATGAKVYDVMGNEYIDLDNGKGSVLLGHNHEMVNEAIIKYLKDNRNFTSGLSPTINLLTEKILSMSGLNHYAIAYFAMGTDACRASALAAQIYTGKRIILSAGYHGWDPMWKTSHRLLEENPLGVIDFFFDPELLETALKKHANNIAMVMISPDYAHLQETTLKKIVCLAKEYGCLFGCDDVKQGFRQNLGCSMQRLLDEPPDLVVFSKGLSNGHRISCIVGNQSIINLTKTMTFTSYFNMVPYIAAIETLTIMENQDVHSVIQRQGNKLIKNLKAVISENSYPVEIIDSTALFQLVFHSDRFENTFNDFALQHGLILYAGDNQAITFAFDDQVLDEIIDKIKMALHDTFANLENDTTQISEERYMQSAWRMIEGVSDRYSYDIRHKYIKFYLKSLQFMSKYGTNV